MNIKEIAAERGFSLYALAKAAGLNQSALHQQVARETGARMEMATGLRLARVLGMTMEELTELLLQESVPAQDEAPVAT